MAGAYILFHHPRMLVILFFCSVSDYSLRFTIIIVLVSCLYSTPRVSKHIVDSNMLFNLFVLFC